LKIILVHNGDTRTKSGHCEVGTKQNEIFNHFHLNINIIKCYIVSYCYKLSCPLKCLILQYFLLIIDLNRMYD